MKFSLLLFLLTLFSKVFAQTYTFDFFIKYESSEENGQYNSEEIDYFNSKNDSYFLRVSQYKKNRLVATLYDFQNSVIHKYEVPSYTENGQLTFKFHYVGSSSVGMKNSLEYSNLKMVETGANNTLKIVFKNEKDASVMETYLKTVPTDINFFPFFRMAAMHPLEANTEFNVKENIMVESATLKNFFTNEVSKIVLKEFKPVTLVLEIPDKK